MCVGGCFDCTVNSSEGPIMDFCQSAGYVKLPQTYTDSFFSICLVVVDFRLLKVGTCGRHCKYESQLLSRAVNTHTRVNII